jgi:glutamate dehydrogenase
MRDRMTELAEETERLGPPDDHEELTEARAFLTWLASDHFTFLGYREYRLGAPGRPDQLETLTGTGLGILRGSSPTPSKQLAPRAVALARSPQPLVLTKANSRSTVHRPSYLDYVGVKRFGEDGSVVGECRFLGLYTTAAYKTRAREIPLLRGKVARIMTRAGFPPDSHDAKGLIDILESLPRDLLTQIDTDELFSMGIGILGLGERQRVRLFVSRDQLDRFVACTLCLPRDRFNTENRLRAGRILAEAFGGDQVDWRLQLSESVIVRVDYVVHCPGGVRETYEVEEIESQIARATRAWSDALRAALVSEHGEQAGLELYSRYGAAFPPGYRADSDAHTAVLDIARIDEQRRCGRPIVATYRRPGDGRDLFRFKLLSAAEVSLSEVVPTFEHMGAEVVDERPYEISPRNQSPVWVYDFGLRCDPARLARAGDGFAEVFLGVWFGELEDDPLNGLVMAAGAGGREITVLRSVLRYLRQAAVAFSDAYMTRTLLDNPPIAAGLVKLFRARFDPEDRDEDLARRLMEEIEESIDGVQSLDEDRILRSFLAVIAAMLRTNYFCRDSAGRPLGYLSFKLDPKRLELLPAPRPRFEIFVYSPRTEGIHLRGGKVARGGVRWSDRREDFRTEVLGLMKAQMVKNALIVPVGSKGGFVVRRMPAGGSADQREEAVACYRIFLRGLLDLTDNYVGDQVVAPERVVRYDDDDPYLVVAADKGTAAFSDIANEVALEYGFWLGDAFASGGSHGYDHKQMGITARGAWEGVKRHFRELGLDVTREQFTVVGIGDMSGDVFGNAMLLSPDTRLLAAFNHRHIFLDPDPDLDRSLAERRRLFELPGSAWSDYDAELISPGGGVYPRAAKSIAISEQARGALGIDAAHLSGADLVRELLKAPVDLLFNGGVGTYVKSSEETNAQVGDRANDAVRVDAPQLRCRVVGEGGNLGLTQRARIEYALRGGFNHTGGLINTDAIDNVAGVNCSDHEVNIKIALTEPVQEGEIDCAQRNRLLMRMTDAVAERVLDASYIQTEAMSLAMAQSVSMLDVNMRLMRHLERVGSLDRELEFLPGEKVIAARRGERRGLVAPELATLMAYCKIDLYEQLLESDLPEDPYLAEDLERYFPAPLPDRFPRALQRHRLRRELVATVVANQLVDRAGISFAFRLGEETGASTAQLARAYAAVREVFEMRELWSQIEALDNQIEAGTQLSMLIEGRRLIDRSARWLVRFNARSPIEIADTISRFAPSASQLAEALPEVLEGVDREAFSERLSELATANVPHGLARRVASLPALLSVFDIVGEAGATGISLAVVMTAYFGLGSRLGLDWLRDRILELPRSDRWQALARTALRDDLHRLHRALTRDALATDPAGGEQAIEAWLAHNAAAVRRSQAVIAEVKAAGTYDNTTLPVVLRELKNLIAEDGG